RGRGGGRGGGGGADRRGRPQRKLAPPADVEPHRNRYDRVAHRFASLTMEPIIRPPRGAGPGGPGQPAGATPAARSRDGQGGQPSSASSASQLIRGRSLAPTRSVWSACSASRGLRMYGQPLSNSSTSSLV